MKTVREFMNASRRKTGERRVEAWLQGRGLCAVQSALAIPNEAGAAFRGDVNTGLQANATFQSGAAAPATTYADQYWLDTTTNTLKKRNAANSAWIVKGTRDETFVIDRGSNTILGLSDIGKTFRATASFTQTLTAAATLGDGWYCFYRVESGSTTVFDPNASENIDGATTKSVAGPSSGIIFCNGTAFYTIGFPAAASAGLSLGGIAKNMCYNGSCRVLAEAAKSLTTSPLYAKVDMWAAWASGGAVSAGTITQDAAATIGTYGKALHLSGITLTGSGVLSIRQRIPSIDAVFYKNKTCSFSAHVLQDSGGALNYAVVIRKPTVVDNYGAVTTIHTGSAVSVATATDTQISTGTSTAAPSFSMGDCSNGIEIEIQITTGAITTKNFRISDMQLEEGTSITEFEQQPLSYELAKCGLQFEKSYDQGTDPGTATNSGMRPMAAMTGTVNCGGGITFKYPKRPGASHTVNTWDGAGTSSKTSQYNSSGWLNAQSTIAAVLFANEGGLILSGSVMSNGTSGFIHYTDDVRL